MAAGCLRAFLKAKSNIELENVIETRLRPEAQKLLTVLKQTKAPKGCPKGIRQLGRTESGSAFIKNEAGVLQRVTGDPDLVLQSVVRKSPGVSAFYATNIPHLIQIMRTNTELLRGPKKDTPVEATTDGAERVHKKQRHK